MARRSGHHDPATRVLDRARPQTDTNRLSVGWRRSTRRIVCLDTCRFINAAQISLQDKALLSAIKTFSTGKPVQHRPRPDVQIVITSLCHLTKLSLVAGNDDDMRELELDDR